VGAHLIQLVSLGLQFTAATGTIYGFIGLPSFLVHRLLALSSIMFTDSDLSTQAQAGKMKLPQKRLCNELLQGDNLTTQVSQWTLCTNQPRNFLFPFHFSPNFNDSAIYLFFQFYKLKTKTKQKQKQKLPSLLLFPLAHAATTF